MSKSNEAAELLKTAKEFLDQRRYVEAEASLTTAIDLLGRGETDDAKLSWALETLAGVHFVQQKFALAASEYQTALQRYEKQASKDDQALLRVLHWLGLSYFNQPDYDKAEFSFRRALALAESRGDDAGNLATSLHQLGFHLYFVGKYREAEPYLLRALPLHEQVKGIGDNATIEDLTRIALTYEHCPEIGKDPEPFLRKAVESATPEGETYNAHVENLCRLGEHVAKQGRFEEADELFSRLLSFIRSAGSDKPTPQWVIGGCVDYFKSRDKIETVQDLLSVERNYDAYGELVQSRLNHAEQTLSEADPAFADALFNSANHLIFNDKYQEAEAQLGRALGCYEKIHGGKSLQVAACLNRICVVNRLLNKFHVAEVAIQRALEIARRNFSDQIIYPRTLENLALLKEAEGETDEAAKISTEATIGMERICGFPSHETLGALYRQSRLLFRIGEFTTAESVIRRAMSAMDRIEELSKYEKSDYFSTLASILEAQKRDPEARELTERAQELFEQAKSENICES
jgi:tetratricopeptide (TPR) repeat protein